MNVDDVSLLAILRKNTEKYFGTLHFNSQEASLRQL